MKTYLKKGFTLIELIVVIAIIGVLAAFLVPSIMGFVNKARRTSDIASAKEIYNNVMMIVDNDREYEGYVTSSGAVTHNVYESIYGKTGSSRRPGSPGVVHVKDKDGSYYDIVEVAGLNASKKTNNRGGQSKWFGIDGEQALFADLLNNQMDMYTKEISVKIKYKPKDATYPLDRWFICYRLDAPDEFEIWSGTSYGGGSGKPLYRLYPDPMI